MAKNKFTEIEEIRICVDYQSGQNPTSLSKKLNCSCALIFNILKRHNIKCNRQNRPSKDKEKGIIEAYKKGISTNILAKQYNCGHGTIDNILKENKIYRKPPNIANPPQFNFKKHYKILQNGCWQWTSYIEKNGYARFAIHYSRKNYKRKRPKRYLAHRFSYEITYGKIPKGKHLHHICHNRSCVNPEHLQIITKSEHVLLDNAICAINARKTHCKRGHPLSGDNLYTMPKGGRACRQCRKEYKKSNLEIHI